MTPQERKEYEKLQMIFLKRASDGDEPTPTQIRRINELGKKSVESRKNKNHGNI